MEINTPSYKEIKTIKKDLETTVNKAEHNTAFKIHANTSKNFPLWGKQQETITFTQSIKK